MYVFIQLQSEIRAQFPSISPYWIFTASAQPYPSAIQHFDYCTVHLGARQGSTLRQVVKSNSTYSSARPTVLQFTFSASQLMIQATTHSSALISHPPKVQCCTVPSNHAIASSNTTRALTLCSPTCSHFSQSPKLKKKHPWPALTYLFLYSTVLYRG